MFLFFTGMLLSIKVHDDIGIDSEWTSLSLSRLLQGAISVDTKDQASNATNREINPNTGKKTRPSQLENCRIKKK
jgi:hypothetical protein